MPAIGDRGADQLEQIHDAFPAASIGSGFTRERHESPAGPGRAPVCFTALDATTVRFSAIGLVVPLDVVEIVKVIDHHAVRLADAVLGGVGRGNGSAPAARRCRDESAPPGRPAVPRALRACRKYQAAARISGSSHRLARLRQPATSPRYRDWRARRDRPRQRARGARVRVRASASRRSPAPATM